MTRYHRLQVGGLYFSGIAMLLDAYATWTRGGPEMRWLVLMFALTAVACVTAARAGQRRHGPFKP